jgi:hypothetical protein
MPMSREKDETVNVSHSLADVSSKFPPRVREERDVLFFPLFFSEKSRVFVPLASSKKKWISLSPARDIMGGGWRGRRRRARRVSLLHRECAHPLGSRQPRDLSDLPGKERDRKKEREKTCTCTYVRVCISLCTSEQTQNLSRSKALAREIQLLLNFSTGDSPRVGYILL